MIKIKISEEKDGALAVVDVDTIWKNKWSNEVHHWLGRTCKVYTKTKMGWKLIMHTGVLQYE